MSASAADIQFFADFARATFGMRYLAKWPAIEAELHVLINARAHPRLLFRPAKKPGAWLIGDPTAPEAHSCVPTALPIAYRAMLGEKVPAAEIARPGSKYAPNAVREQLRRARTWAAERSPLLAAAMRGLSVRAGFVVFEKPADALVLLR